MRVCDRCRKEIIYSEGHIINTFDYTRKPSNLFLRHELCKKCFDIIEKEIVLTIEKGAEK
jgi:hypothetical protein